VKAKINDHTIKYCAVPYGDITAVVRSQDGAAQYLIGISIMKEFEGGESKKITQAGWGITPHPLINPHKKRTFRQNSSFINYLT
jgi:hypothetical protein